MIEFQSGHPVRGATRPQRPRKALCPNFNPRAPCGARRDRRCGDHARADISIHAPRVGRDVQILGRVVELRAFQSTRPVWGATTRTTGRACRHGQFQSTRPVWGATRAGSLSLSLSTYFNPRAPCGARPRARASPLQMTDFNPRAPCGARRACVRATRANADISIHAPRVGRDRRDHPLRRPCPISIHAPRVGRDKL